MKISSFLILKDCDLQEDPGEIIVERVDQVIEEVVEAQNIDVPADDPQCSQDIIPTEHVTAHDKSYDNNDEPNKVSEELVEEVAEEEETIPMEPVHVLEPEKEKKTVFTNFLHGAKMKIFLPINILISF